MNAFSGRHYKIIDAVPRKITLATHFPFRVPQRPGASVTKRPVDVPWPSAVCGRLAHWRQIIWRRSAAGKQ